MVKTNRWTVGASTLGLGEDGLGARALRRALRQFLEDPIAFRILQHQVRSRCEVTVSLEICDAVFTLIFSHWKPLKLTTEAKHLEMSGNSWRASRGSILEHLLDCFGVSCKVSCWLSSIRCLAALGRFREYLRIPSRYELWSILMVNNH